jgi:hypothetical protein
MYLHSYITLKRKLQKPPTIAILIAETTQFTYILHKNTNYTSNVVKKKSKSMIKMLNIKYDDQDRSLSCSPYITSTNTTMTTLAVQVLTLKKVPALKTIPSIRSTLGTVS